MRGRYDTGRLQRGLTLVEMLVAAVLGLVLIGGVISIYVGSKTAYRTQEELGRIQENARFAIEVINRDLRMAGYMGCYAGASITDNVSSPPVNGGFFTDPIIGYEGMSATSNNASDWSPTLPSYLTNAPVAGSDVIAVERADPFDALLVGNLTSSNANIQIDGNPDNWIVAGSILFLSDCQDADIFRATNVSSGGAKVTIAHAASGNNTPKLSKLYGPNSRLMMTVHNTYYVGTNSNGGRSLYRVSLVNSGSFVIDELIDGVETLQIAYGEDTSGDGIPNRYVGANNVTNRDDIVSIRVGLLMYTPEQVTLENETRTFNVAGTEVKASGSIPTHGGDRSLRQVYAATVKVRNRGMQ